MQFFSSFCLSFKVASTTWGISWFNQHAMLPEHAFGCFFNYLFRMRPALQQKALPLYSQLVKRSHTTYCLQVRVGDIVNNRDLNSKQKSWSELHRITSEVFLDCVRDIEEFRLAGGHPALPIQYFLLSDNALVRKYFEHRLEKGVALFQYLAGEAATYESLRDAAIGTKSGAGISPKVRAVHEKIFIELFLLQHACDFHVLSGFSGFGMVGALSALRPTASIANVLNPAFYFPTERYTGGVPFPKFSRMVNAMCRQGPNPWNFSTLLWNIQSGY
jgi:hypothetical protein